MSFEDTLRKSHYLRILQKGGLPSNYLFFDAMTSAKPVSDSSDLEIHTLRLWCARAVRIERGKATRRAKEYGFTAAAFWDFVESRADELRPLWIFTNNLGFDLATVDFWDLAIERYIEFQQIPSEFLSVGSAARKKKWTGVGVIEDPPTILKCRLQGTGKTLIFLDVLNYWKSTLADLGESLGLPAIPAPEANAEERVWMEYADRNSAIIERAILELTAFLRRHNFGRLEYTAPGLAFAIWRSAFLPSSRTLLIHGNQQTLKLERAAYYGGATRPFFLGRVAPAPTKDERASGPLHTDASLPSPLYVLDVRSFYPSIMAQQKMPAKLQAHIIAPSRLEVERAMENYGCVARVWLDCAGDGYPVRRKEATFYATGKFQTVLCGPELERAFAEGCVRKIGEFAYYYEDDLFSKFVETFDGLRRDYERAGNSAFAFLSKSILNSLYGKFAQRGGTWHECQDKIAPIPMGYWFETIMPERTTEIYRALAWLPQKQERQPEWKYSCPIVSAFITAYGREKMLRLRNMAGTENVVYQDTDSLHVLESGYKRLRLQDAIREGELGHLQLVATVDEAVYRGPKNYRLDGREIVAGLKESAERIDGETFEQTVFPKIQSVIADENSDCLKVGKKLFTLRPRPGNYVIKEDGWTRPYNLQEW